MSRTNRFGLFVLLVIILYSQITTTDVFDRLVLLAMVIFGGVLFVHEKDN